MDDFPPTVGEWYHTFPTWKQNTFNLLCRIIGDYPTIWMFGYWRHVNKKAKKS